MTMIDNKYPTKELMQQYRNVFSQREAVYVLTHMLIDLGFFDENTTQENLPLKNYGMRLLGILGGGNISSGAVTALLNSLKIQPLPNDTFEIY